MAIKQKIVDFDEATQARLNYVLVNEEHIPETLKIFDDLLNIEGAEIKCVERYKDLLVANIIYEI